MNLTYLIFLIFSFGFGGANVHAILESYEPGDSAHPPGAFSSVAIFTPFVFSAFTEKSLISNLEKFYEYLQYNSNSFNLRNIAYTLHSRRTCFQFTTAITSSSVEDLCRKVAKMIHTENDADNTPITRVPRQRTSQSSKPCFLGIFVSAFPSRPGGNKPGVH